MTVSAIQRQYVVVDGNRIAYLECGAPDAPPVILVHGLMSDSGTWQEVLEPFSALGVRAIAIDLLGHGRSDAPRGLYLLDDFALLLDGFMAELGLADATLCGHSLGGAIAVHFGYHYPGRVRRLVLVSAGGLGREVSPALRMLALPGAEALTGAVLGRDRAARAAGVVRRDGVPRRARADAAGLVAARRDHSGRTRTSHARAPAGERTGRVPRRRSRAAPTQRACLRQRCRRLRSHVVRNKSPKVRQRLA